VSAFDGQSIRRTNTADAPTTRASVTSNSARAATFLDLPRVLLALGIVLALILVLRWLVRRIFPNAVSRSSDVVRVLARTPITPRQQVLLVQVGQRVLVVADNGTQLSALSVIKEPDEFAALVGRLSPARSSDSEAFHAALDQSQRQYEQLEPDAGNRETEARDSADQESPPPAAHSELAGLMDKVRVLAKQLGR
jgi:flagellar biogenesis protein FliO